MRDVVIGFDVGKRSAGVVVIDLRELLRLKPKNFHKAVVKQYNWTLPGSVPENLYLARLVGRFHALEEELKPDYHICYVAFEQYVLTKGSAGKASHLILAHGLLRALAAWMLVPYTIIYPATLKSFVCGGIKDTTTGKMAKRDKNLIMKYAFRKFGYDTDNDDMVDAFVLALLAGFLYLDLSGMPARSLDKLQAKTIQALKKKTELNRLGWIPTPDMLTPCRTHWYTIQFLAVVGGVIRVGLYCHKCSKELDKKFEYNSSKFAKWRGRFHAGTRIKA